MDADAGDAQARAALAAGAAGLELLRLERYAPAAAALDRALARPLPAASDPGAGEALLLRAEWAAARLSCLVELGHLDAARTLLPQAGAAIAALAAMPQPLPARTAARAAAEASCELDGARLHFRAGQLDEARAATERALARVQGQTMPLLRARIELQLGGLLGHAGEPERALALWQSAEEVLAGGALQGHVLLRARLAMNRGAANADLGRHGAAATALQEALALFEGLVASGQRGAVAELARALRNQGFALGRAGRQAHAVPVLERAVATCGQALRQAVTPADRQALRFSRGGTLNSLGYSLFSLGRLEDARSALRRGEGDLASVAKPVGSVIERDERARLWANRAHVEAHERRFGAARRLYARAAAHFEERARSGAVLTAANGISARLGLARVAQRQQHIAEAAALFAPAMRELAGLTRQGQLQHENAWLAAWQAQRDAWLAAVAARVDAANMRASKHASKRAALADDAAVTMLVAALATPPQHAAGLGPEPLHALADAAGTGVAWALPPTAARGAASPDAERVAVAHLKFLLDWVAELLADHDPQWIHAHRNAADAAIEALRANAAEREQAAPLLAQWFIATRGLRAQRSALAEGHEPEIDRLRELLRRLHRIEQEILGERAGPISCEGSSDLRQAAAMATLAGPGGAAGGPASATVSSARQLEWRDLSAQVRQVRSQLVDRGLLPAAQRLEAGELLARLSPGQALVLLARPRADRLLVIALCCEAPSAQRFNDQALMPLDAELAAFPCATLHALARSAWARGAMGATGATNDSGAIPQADRFALAMFRRLWELALRPALRGLLARGITTVDLVPSGDLHLVPWNHLADADWAGRLRLYPSTGAWWRCSGDVAEAEMPHGPRWALAAGAAVAERLRWVDVESRLSQRLWGAAMQPMDGLTEADALLGIGHGLPPDANAAQVGLLVAEGGDGRCGPDGSATLLQPHHLLRLRGCRHALLSACLLGHTDGTPGEALGFVSACFDHRFVFAAGWLTEVGDHAACLYSLAAQWALKQRSEPARAPRRGGWSDTLAEMRRQLLRGAWPAGFAHWLDDEWAAVAGTTPPAAPPAALLRALPWAVTLG